MAPNQHNTLIPLKKSVITVFAGLIIIGFGTFVYNLLGQHPEVMTVAQLEVDRVCGREAGPR